MGVGWGQAMAPAQGERERLATVYTSGGLDDEVVRELHTWLRDGEVPSPFCVARTLRERR